MGQIDCKTETALCARFYVNKHPTVVFFKSIGYEVHHGE